MTRFFGLLTAISFAAPAFAELTVLDHEANDGVELYQLTVTPAAEPVPAFKHRLLTPLHKLKPGNAPAYYRRVHAERGLSGDAEALTNEFGDMWYDWGHAETPLSRVPLDSLRRAVGITRQTVAHGVRAGAACRRCDWGLAVEDLRGPETIEFLLPEFQGMRDMTRFVSLHTRLAIAEQRYGDAIDFMRVNYRMGRDTGKVPFLVCVLIGIAQTGITNNNALDLMAAPDSPNLYWALSELPDPIVPLREAVRFEMSIGTRIFPVLEDAETATRAPEEWNRLFREASEIIPEVGWVGGQSKGADAALAAFGGVAAGVLGYPHAKRRLVDWGYDAAEVEAMAVGRVLAIYSARSYRLHADNFEKLFYTPFSVDAGVPPRDRNAVFGGDDLKNVGPFSDHPDRELLPIAELLLPAVSACRKAEIRVRREMALLRAIEAVRMHAAVAGSLPASLADVRCVPVPKNPATDRPFEYTLEGATAVFLLPKSERVMNFDRRYEIRLVDRD